MEIEIVNSGMPMRAAYSDEIVEEVLLPLLRCMTKLQEEKQRRILVMLAGAPASGKSTLAAFLKYLSEHTEGVRPVTVIGMDGFHRYQDHLLCHTVLRDGEEIPMVKIKGAPVTFDLERLTERIRRVAAGEECGWPEYDRLHHDPREDAIRVQGDIVLLEGNYLLLEEPGWRELRQYADLTIRLTAPLDQIRERLIRRKMATGVSYEETVDFVERSDLYNARLCLEHSGPADCMLGESGESGGRTL